MFDGLAAIDWSSLVHAYGPADDVPDLMRRLALGGQATADALGDLYGNIYHQGTVYQATAFGVPFLVEIAADRGVPGDARRAALRLLWDVAGGTSYLDVHGPILLDRMTADRRAEVARLTGEELRWVSAVRAGVADGADVYLRLLDDADPALRAAAAQPLAAAGQRVGDVLPRLRGRLSIEADPSAAASMLFAVAVLAADLDRPADVASADHFVSTFLSPARPPVVRLAAAVAATQLRADAADLAPVLLATVGPAAADVEALPCSNGYDVIGTVDPFLARHPGLRTTVLVGLLDHPVAAIRSAAIHAAGWNGRRPPPPAAVDALVGRITGLLDDGDPTVRSAAATFLGGIGGRRDAAAAVLARVALADPDARVRTVATSAVARVRSPDVLPTLLVLLDRDPPHPTVVQAIGDLGPTAAAAAPRLVRLMAGGGNLATLATLAVVKLGPAARASALPVLLSALAGRGPALPVATLGHALGEYGREAAAAAPGLRRLLAGTEAHGRAQAAAALYRVTGDAAPAVSALVPMLTSTKDAALANVARCLGRIGRPAAEAAPALRPLLSHRYNWVRVEATVALWRTTGAVDEVLPVLGRDLHAGPVSVTVAECLLTMGPAAGPLLPRMREALADADPLPFAIDPADTDDKYRRLLTAAIAAAEGVRPDFPYDRGGPG